MKYLFFILLCPPWAQWLSPQLPWHLLGHRNPLFFGYHSMTQKLLQSCAQSLKTGCLPSPLELSKQQGTQPFLQHASPPLLSSLPQAVPSIPPIQGNLPLVQQKTFLKPYSTKSYLYPKSSGSFQGSDFRNQSSYFLFFFDTCHIPPFGQ